MPCTRGTCDRILGTCSIACCYFLHGRRRRHRFWVRCSHGKYGPVVHSCNSLLHRRHRLVRQCAVECSRGKGGRVGRNCSNRRHLRHRHDRRCGLEDSPLKCVLPRCNCSKSWTDLHRHHRQNDRHCHPHCEPLGTL